MLLPAKNSYRIIFLAWGVAFFVLQLPGRIKHDIAVSLFGCVSFTETAYAQTQIFDQIEFWGLALGFLLSGILSDRFGRFRIMLWTLLFTPCFSALSGLAFGICDFLFFRFLTGISAGGLLLSSSLLVAETRPKSQRLSAVIALLLGAATAPFFVFLFEKAVYSLPFLPYSPWRSFLLLAALFVGSFFYARRFYDEPLQWKQQVRDQILSGKSNHLFSLSDRFSLSNCFVLFLFLFALILGLRTIFIQSGEYVRQSTLNSFDQKTKKQAPLDSTLLACIVRYPQLLGMKEAETLNLDEMPERFRNAYHSENNLPLYLAEAVLELHRKGEDINIISLIDQAMERKNQAAASGQSASEIPLYELEYYAKATSDYLQIGNRTLNAMKILPVDPALTKATLWQQRMSVFKTLWNNLREHEHQRFTATWKQQQIFTDLFFLGGFLTIFVLYLSREINSPKLSVLFVLFFLMLILSFVPLSGSRYFLQSHYFAPFLGIVSFLLMRKVLLTPSAFFKTPVRGTLLGIGLLFACLVAYVSVPNQTAEIHALTKLLKELLIFYCLFFFLISPLARYRLRSMKTVSRHSKNGESQ